MARILLVDDEKLARTLYADYLTGAGHEVTAVGSTPEAKQALTDCQYDVVVTDLILPEGDGMEVLRHAKERHPGVEVVVITALDKVDPAVRAIKSGAAEYLVKPVAPEALQHAVSRAMTTKQLLRENASLREYVTLLEAGQRVATSLDRDQLIATALSSFSQVAGARAVLIYQREKPGEFTFQGAHGLEAGKEPAIRAVIEPHLRELGDAPGELPAVPEGFQSAIAYPARDGEATWGYTILIFDHAAPETTFTSAAYLARNLGVAFRNLGRFAEVEDLAYLDDLTHLFNRRYLDLVLDRELRNAHQIQSPFSVLFLDLDYFKSVNDTHGHVVGSQLLVEVARVVKGCVRDVDVVCRYGGDEYVVLLRATDSGGALKVGERIRRSIEAHQFLAREGLAMSVTTCIGVASYPEHAKDKVALLDLADRAMYRGKRSSRNVIYIAAKDLEATPPGRHSPPVTNAG